MTTLFILLSMAGLAYLQSTDPKRRRINGLPAVESRRLLWPARLAVFGPGVALTAMGHWSGLSIWGGAVTTLGWAMAALPPQVYAAQSAVLSEAAGQLRSDAVGRLGQGWATVSALTVGLVGGLMQRLPALPTGNGTAGIAGTSAQATIAALEDRIAQLEARLLRLEGGPDGLATDGPTPLVLTPHSHKPLDAAE